VKGLIPRLNIQFTFQDAIIAFKSIFAPIFVTDHSCLYFNHGRTGLRIALSSLNLPEGSKVGVMVYNCYSVMNAVKLAGFDIEFIDVTDNFCLDINDFNIKKNNLNALIVTHLFGIPTNIEEIKKLCPSLPIIEDCAHSFLSEIDGHLTGSMGDMAVFSMGLGKFPSIGPGGYLKVNNSLYSDRINTIYGKLPLPSFLSELKNIGLSLLLGALHQSVIYHYFTKPFLKQKNNKLDDEIRYSHDESKILKSSQALYMAKLEKYPMFLKIQQLYADKIFKVLKAKYPNAIYPTEYNLNKLNCFMFPLLIENRQQFMNQLERKGIETGQHFSHAIEWAKKFGYKVGSCKNAEKITEQIVVCPCHYNLSEKKIELINRISL